MYVQQQIVSQGSTDICQFDLKFTKGNTIAAPNKLFHLQKRYAQKYVEEGGKEYIAMIDKVLALAEEHLLAHPEYKESSPRLMSLLTASFLLEKGFIPPASSKIALLLW